MKGINGGLVLGIYTYGWFWTCTVVFLGGWGDGPWPEDRVRVAFLKYCKGAYWSATLSPASYIIDTDLLGTQGRSTIL
jgi:hypothetical protein